MAGDQLDPEGESPGRVADLRCAAIHEAGHAAVAFLCGFTCAGPVSIEPGRAYSGICWPGHAARPAAGDLATSSRPVPLQAAGLRRYHELEIMVSLAGDVAADMFWWRGRPGRVPELPSGQIVAGLSRREAGQLADAAAADDVGSDAARVAEILRRSHGTAGSPAAVAYCRWLEAEVRSLLGGPGVGMVHALSVELMAARVLSPRAWRAIAAAAA